MIQLDDSDISDLKNAAAAMLSKCQVNQLLRPF